ncbi:MAG TPA: CRISPR-associated protein Csx19 [Pyrinomonadaceae bacterium]|jgi:CRISPR-associated protein (TIGR03984 family)
MSEIKLFAVVNGFKANSYAILYAPKKCYLALFDGTDFVDESGKINVSDVYEARIFNAEKELRWLSSGETETLTDDCLREVDGFVGTIDQKYLLWGEISPSNDSNVNGEWTELAEARIGKFYVPIKTTSRACFEAKEYLKEFADGNVAVFEERLTGISEVK